MKNYHSVFAFCIHSKKDKTEKKNMYKNKENLLYLMIEWTHETLKCTNKVNFFLQSLPKLSLQPKISNNMKPLLFMFELLLI